MVNTASLNMAVTMEQELKMGLNFSDRAACIVTGTRDRDAKSDAFEDGSDNRVGVENDTLDFDDGAAGGVIRTRDRDVKGDAFEDDSNDRAGTKNDTLNFSDEATGGVPDHETETTKVTHLNIAVTAKEEPP